jgi:hypothetical protein
MVAYYASAEIGCYLGLGWPLPVNVIDLYAEFRCQTNGLFRLERGAKLIHALGYYGLDAMSAAEKADMQKLAQQDRDYSEEEWQALVAYCLEDSLGCDRLLPVITRNMCLPDAVLRGRFMKAAAAVERNGIPMDVALLSRLRKHWEAIKRALVADEPFGLYDGTSFREERFRAFLAQRGYGWPEHASGRLMLDDDTFKMFAGTYPEIGKIRELRAMLAKLRLEQLAVGADGRNRTLLSAFRAITGRNQPSNTKSIFGPAVGMRGLIRPGPGRAIAYLDWSGHEFAIAAGMSGDENMRAAYESGDPYLWMAAHAGKAPPSATKKTHGPLREAFKVVAHGINYGMGPESLAIAADMTVIEARYLLSRVRNEFFPVCFRWLEGMTNRAMLGLPLTTCWGWEIRADGATNPRSLRNFPIQSAGNEMMRAAVIAAIESGIRVDMSVHDALLVEDTVERIAETAARTASIMEHAGRVVSAGLSIRVGVEVVRHPDRYLDPRGLAMWERVNELLTTVEAADNCNESNQFAESDGR